MAEQVLLVGVLLVGRLNHFHFLVENFELVEELAFLEQNVDRLHVHRDLQEPHGLVLEVGHKAFVGFGVQLNFVEIKQRQNLGVLGDQRMVHDFEGFGAGPT